MRELLDQWSPSKILGPRVAAKLLIQIIFGCGTGHPEHPLQPLPLIPSARAQKPLLCSDERVATDYERLAKDKAGNKHYKYSTKTVLLVENKRRKFFVIKQSNGHKFIPEL